MCKRCYPLAENVETMSVMREIPDFVLRNGDKKKKAKSKSKLEKRGI